MKGGLSMAVSMAMADGLDRTNSATLENSMRVWRRESASTRGKVAHGSRGLGSMALWTDRVSITIKMVMYTRVNGKTIRNMARGPTNFKMATSMLEIGSITAKKGSSNSIRVVKRSHRLWISKRTRMSRRKTQMKKLNCNLKLQLRIQLRKNKTKSILAAMDMLNR